MNAETNLTHSGQILEKIPGSDPVATGAAATGSAAVGATASEAVASEAVALGAAATEAVATDAVALGAAASGAPKKATAKKNSTGKATKKGGKDRKNASAKSDDTSVHTWRLRDDGVAALDVLEVLWPEKSRCEVVTDALKIAAGQMCAAPIIRFSTVIGAEMILVQGATAKLEKILKAFRKDLITIQKDPEMVNQMAQLVGKIETELVDLERLRNRLGTLAMLPKTLSPANLQTLRDFKLSLHAWRKAATEDEKPVFDLALKLLTPYLP